jgi:mRNA-degrading endonuclease RelE of RelBE toxin-antitoxin system
MNEITWHNRARKQMKSIPAEYREAIHERVDMLVDFPGVAGLDVKELRISVAGWPLSGAV